MMPRRTDQKSILLADLLPALSGMEWARHRVVNSIALDSREVGDEGLWLALQGTRGHALDHLADARGRGAVAVLAEPAGQWDRDRIAALAGEVPVIAVPGLRRQAGEIAARAPLAVQLAKQAVNQAFETSLTEGLMDERYLFYMLFASQDQQEGMAAFVEKRPANWQGK